MKIAADTINFSTSHDASARHTIRETLRAWIGGKRPDFEAMEKTGEAAPAADPTRVSLSAKALRLSQAPPPSPPQESSEAQAIKAAADSVENEPMLTLLKTMVEIMTGHKIRVTTAADFEVNAQPVEGHAPPPSQTAPSRPRAGFGVEYDRQEIVDETEHINVQAEGKVLTADGREIDFKLTLAMSRHFHEESNV